MSQYYVLANPEKCAGCRACQLRCSLRQEGAFMPAKARIQVRRLVGERQEFSISFASECDGCGICVKYCAYGALAREKRG